MLLDKADEMGMVDARRLLLSSKTRQEESVLHTVMSEAVLDYLMMTNNDDPYQLERSDMMDALDKRGYNVLRTFIEKDKLDLAKLFLDYHITSIEGQR
jgi:hypothetical protein